jgi:hypothetical protein
MSLLLLVLPAAALAQTAGLAAELPTRQLELSLNPRQDTAESRHLPPPASPPRSPLQSGAALSLLCAASLNATDCASVPVRPTQQECPRAAIKAMDQREWDKFTLWIKPELRKNGELVTVRPGPIISMIKPTPISDLTGKEILHGHVYFAGDGRVVVRYTEVVLESGERVPICFAIVPFGGGSIDIEHKLDKTEESVTTRADQFAERVPVLPD